MWGIERAPWMIAIAGLSFFAGSCRTGGGDGAYGSVSEFPDRCTARQIPTRAFPEDSFPRADRCRLVGLAVASLGRAAPSSGLVPADTSRIESALLVPISEETPEGVLIRAAWHVELSLKGLPYNAEVIFRPK